MRLSKSKYQSGLQCEKRLWLELHEPEEASEPSAAQELIFDRGTEVGVLAR